MKQQPKIALEVTRSREVAGGLGMDREYGFKGFILERRGAWINRKHTVIFGLIEIQMLLTH
jgi:hypothetical protein